MRFAFKTLVFLISFVLTFALALGIAGFVLEDRIVASTIASINEQLSAELKVKSVSVSFLRGFPKAVVTLKGVEIFEGSIDTPREFESGLLSLDEVNVGFNLLDLMRRELNVERLVLKNGWINLYYDSKGKGNFEIFSKNGKSPSSWILNLGSLVLDNINLSYIDLRTGWIFKGLLQDIRIHGQLSQDKTLLSIDGTGMVGVLRQGSFYYIRNEKTTLTTTFSLSDEQIDILPSSGKLGSSKFTFAGNVARQKGDPSWVEINGTDFGVQGLVSFLSQHNISVPSGTKTKGNVAFKLGVSGYSQEEKPYQISFSFNTESLEVSLPGKIPVTISNLKGEFSNGALGKPESSEIHILAFDAKTGSSSFNGSLKVKNLLSPLYHLKVNQLVYVPDILSWGVKTPLLDGVISGDFEALGMIANLDSITLQSFEDSKFYSTLALSRVVFHQVGSIPDLQDISGLIRISNQDISTAKIEGLLFGTKFGAEIQATNATALVFGRNKTSINANIVLDSLNTKSLASLVSTSQANKSQANTWDRISTISGDVFIDKFIHDKFEAQPLSASFYTNSANYYCNSFLARTCGGLLTGKFRVTTLDDATFSFGGDINADAIDVSNLFASFHNFGQSTITSQNISGELVGSIALSVPLKGMSVNFDKLEASASLMLSNGRLVNVEPLQNLSKFIEVDELKDITFSKLGNVFTINDKTIIIPEMEIVSSALNLTLSGVHSFNGDYQYRVQVLLSDLLFGKASRRKEANSTFGEVVEDGSGRANLHLKLEGDSASFNVSYDVASARNAFRQSLMKEKLLLKDILREEFSFFSRIQQLKDSLDVKGDTLIFEKEKVKIEPKKGKKKKEETSKFIIEWD